MTKDNVNLFEKISNIYEKRKKLNEMWLGETLEFFFALCLLIAS